MDAQQKTEQTVEKLPSVVRRRGARESVAQTFPASLAPLASLFAQTYDPASGGYLAPTRHEMEAFTAEDVAVWQSTYSKPQYDSIELEVALFLYGILRMTGAKHVLETGCSRGFSTCFIAAAVSDNGGGSVTSVDVEDIFHLWTGSDLEPIIQFVNGSSTHVFPQVREGRQGKLFDALFLDSLHTYVHLMSEIMLYDLMLKVGGTIILHDTLFYDCLGPVAMALNGNPRFEVSTLPTPRRHTFGQSSRSPGVTIATKISDDVKKFPLQISQEFVTWSNPVVTPLNGDARTVLSESVLDIMRKEKLAGL